MEMKKSKLNQKEEQFKIKIGPFTGPIIFCLAYLPVLFIESKKGGKYYEVKCVY